MAIAWAVALAASVLGAEVRLEGGLRAEGRSRTVDTRVTGQPADRLTTAEVSITPRAAADVLSPDAALRLQYAPTLRAPDVLTSTSPDVLHAAELRARLRLLPTWSLTAIGGAERGRTDLVAESRRQATAPDAIPTTAVLRYASARLDLTLDGSLDPRTTLSFGAGGFASGGDDAPSRAVMPVERGVRAGAGVEWSATRLDALSLQGSALGARFMGDREAALGTLTTRWRRRLDPAVEGAVRAGALASWSRAPGESAHRALLPTGEVALAHTAERIHASEDLAVRLGAGVDRVTGSVDRQIEVAASARWAPLSSWSFAATATGAIARQASGQSRRGAFELRVGWAYSPQLTAAFGLYGHVQRSPEATDAGAAALPSFVEGGGFLSLAYDLPRRG